MIIWTGCGPFVLVIGGGCLVLTQLLVNAASQDSQYYQSHAWPKVLGCLVAAVITWRVGRRLNSRPGRALMDLDTGEIEYRKTQHTLFFIPFEYWAPIIAAFGLLAAADQLFGH